jgi:hypothetical protein
MTLKEKFEKEIENDGNSKVLLKYKCSNIADEFAIGFAEWVVRKRLYDKEIYYLSSYKQLLEIYKKEKGL